MFAVPCAPDPRLERVFNSFAAQQQEETGVVRGLVAPGARAEAVTNPVAAETAATGIEAGTATKAS